MASASAQVESLRAQVATCQLGAESEFILLQHTLSLESAEKARLRISLATAQLDRYVVHNRDSVFEVE